MPAGRQVMSNEIMSVTRYSLLYCLLFCFLFIAPTANAADFYPFNFIAGDIKAADSVPTGNRRVILYQDLNSLQSGIYVSAESDPGSYLLNTYGVTPAIEPFVEIGNKYFVYIPNDKLDNPILGYGADPVSVTLSGRGLDLANLELKKGAGNLAPGNLGGVPPLFDWIKFGNRLYQRALVEKGEKFIISATPKISAKISSKLAINTNRIYLKVNEAAGAAAAQTILIKEMNISNKELSSKAVGDVTALSFSYDVPEQNKLTEGENTISFIVENSAGITMEVANVKVMAGPVQVVGSVLSFPSPFSPTRDREMTIQYTLSGDTNTDVFIFSPVGGTIKKFIIASGQNGAAAGVNKITWNGVAPDNSISGNGVYNGAIVAREEGRILAKFKFAIVD